MAITRLITADELLEMELPPGRYDLIDGELYHMAAAGGGHGRLTMQITLPVGNYVVGHGLGEVFAAETGFVLAEDPDVVVAPDLAFVRSGRLEPRWHRRGYLRIVPDFAVEVVSPSDYPKLIQLKLDKYLEARIPLLILVYPEQQSVRVFRDGREAEVLGIDDVLDGGDVLPGFQLAMAELFR